MKVELGTIEVDNRMRRAIAHLCGFTRPATSAQVRGAYRWAADALFECFASDYDEHLARAAAGEKA